MSVWRLVDELQVRKVDERWLLSCLVREVEHEGALIERLAVS